MRKRAVIYTANGLPFIRKDVSKTKARLFLLLERIANFMNGKVISCSRSEAEELTKRGIPGKYISNGTEIQPSYDRQPNDVVVVATSGRSTVQKNPALFNEIASKFASDKRVRFVWIGHGELNHLLTSGNITVTGWMTRSDASNVVRNADVYLSTASWEGLPLAVIEAMHLAKPLLLTRCVGNVDLVIDGYNGFGMDTAAEAATKILGFLEDRSTILQMGTHSRELAIREFSVEDMAVKYDVEYRRLAKQ
jgi:glycosyltransferase involved in cell wall biosynthesis